jgi:3-oxoadipate enol-lactonase
VRAGGQEAYARSTAARWLAEPAEPLLTRLQSMMMATPIQGFEAGALALSDFDFTATLQAITCPALLVAGEKDGKLPETMREMAGSIPGSRFEIIAGAGHIPCCERPDAFNALLLAFLETLT